MTTNNETLSSINISGSGSAGGGQFDTVKISGSGKINGPMTCNMFKCSGSAKVDGDLEAIENKVSGSAKFTGNVKGDYFVCSGSAAVDKSMDVKTIKSSGSLSVEEHISAEKIKVSGSIKVGQDCNAEEFYLSGGCKIGGLLNAGKIEIKIGGRCEIFSIGAENIVVEQSSSRGLFGGMLSSLFGQDGVLNCEVIEGDDIYLEHTICDVVRGKTVRIGKNCVIKTVEYSDVLEVAKSAKIENEIHV